MSAHPDDRTISVSSIDGDERSRQQYTEQEQYGEQADGREPVGADGQPIFPPQSATAGAEPGEDLRREDLRAEDPRAEDPRNDGLGSEDDRRRDAEFGADDGDDPGAHSAAAGRLLPDGTGQAAAQQYPTQAVPAMEYPATEDPATAYPATEDPATAYPATEYQAPAGQDAAVQEPGLTGHSGQHRDLQDDAGAHQVSADDDEWQALKLKFVDDPAQAVRDAADRVERELAAARSRLDQADTEELRTAFRRFRDLSDALR